MITYIKIDGFKSFKDFEMHFTPFTVIAGANGSGKSNLFDALQLLSDLAGFAGTSLGEAFGKQRGNGTELFTQYANGLYAEKMSFTVEMLVPTTVADDWGESAELRHTRLRYELTIGRGVKADEPYQLRVLHEQLTLITKKEDKWTDIIPEEYRHHWIPNLKQGEARHKPYIETQYREGETLIQIAQDSHSGKGKEVVASNITRTLLSGVDSVRFAHAYAVRKEISSWRFLALNTEDLRQPTPKVAGYKDSMTATGANMAAALHRMAVTQPEVLDYISQDLARLVFPLNKVIVREDIARNEYTIEVSDNDGKTFSSRLLSEGTLRSLALAIAGYDDQFSGLLCYEEPENGIHPGKLPDLVRMLSEWTVDFTNPEAPLKQLVINSHSPIVVAEVLNLEYDWGGSVWFTQIASRWATVDGNKYPVKVTYILPVVDPAKRSPASVLPQHPNDKLAKLTLHQVREYLTTGTNLNKEVAA